MNTVFSPTKLIATVAAILLLLPASAQWNNIAPLNSGHSIKFVSGSVGYLQNVYTMQKSTDGGVTWTTIDSVGGAFTQTGMFWLNANEGFAVYSEHLGFGNYTGWFKKTSNGGSSWTAMQQVSGTSALYAVWFTSSSTGFVVGENGTIRKTINGGTSWTTLSSTTSLDLYSIEFVSATTGWVGGDDGIILKTTNATTWTQQFSSIFYEFQDICFTDLMNGCATGTYGLMRTTNGGANWNPVSVYGTYQFLAIDFPSADTGYMTSVGGNVFRTIDGGASWIGLNHVGNGYFVRDIDFISNDTGYVTCDFDGTFKTTNAGSGCPTLTVQNTVSMPDTIHACAGTYGVFTAAASAMNPYVFNVSPAWVWDTAMSYGQYFYVNDSIANDTLQIIITMLDTTTNCGMLTDMMILITDSTTYQPLSQPTWLISLCPGDSVVLDLGPNAEDGYFWQMSMDSTQTITVDTVGMYTGMAYACGNTYNYFFFVQWDTTCTQVCDVDAGPDTIFCQQQGQLMATPASPGNYTFSWSPPVGLDNPGAQNPNVIGGVHNQQYVVTMIDTSANCSATDTVVVSAYYFSAGDTFLVCNNFPVTLDFGPGASAYYWQYFTDTSGNTTNLNATTQTYQVTQPGTYMGYAMFPNCGALTSVFTVVDSCSSTCTANILQQTLYSDSCGDSMRFVGTYTGTIGQWHWTLNNQTVGFGYGGIPTLDLHIGAGTYNVELFILDVSSGCYDSTDVTINGANGLYVDISVIQVCNVAWNSQSFNPTVISASPNLVYSWSPATGLSNPNIANPFVNNVFNVTYTLTVTDTVTGCSASDTASAIVGNFINDTIYSCDSLPVYLSAADPASLPPYTFSWSTGATTPGIYVTNPGQYFVVIQTGICTYTSVFTVIDSCTAYVGNVWPGDCNYDLIVNMADALHVGLGYGATGATRPGASNAWYAQPMNDWVQNYANCNYKHGDANGDGTIDIVDTLPIALNYSLTHPFRHSQPVEVSSAAPLTLVCIPDTVGLQTLVQIDVVLGSVAVPIDSLYGISFRITSEAFLIDTSLTAINANNSWLGNTGTDMFTFQKHFLSNAVIDFAEVKNNHINTTNGSGVIATFFIVTTDNLSGIETCNFDLTDITAVTEGQTYIALTPVNDSVVIDPSVMPGFSEYEPALSFSMYPNPANDKLTVQTAGAAEVIEICDMSGRVVMSINPNNSTTVIETASLANGMYFVNVKNGASVVTEKLTISR